VPYPLSKFALICTPIFGIPSEPANQRRTSPAYFPQALCSYLVWITSDIELEFVTFCLAPPSSQGWMSVLSGHELLRRKLYLNLIFQHLLRTLTESQVRPTVDLRLLLTTVKEGRVSRWNPLNFRRLSSDHFYILFSAWRMIRKMRKIRSSRTRSMIHWKDYCRIWRRSRLCVEATPSFLCLVIFLNVGFTI
jgi:hypothetical protein